MRSSFYFRKFLKVAPLSLAIWRSIEAYQLAKNSINYKRPILDIGCGFGEFAGVFFNKTVDVNNFEQINEFLLTNQVLYVFQYYWFPQQRWENQYPNIFTLVKRFSSGFNDNTAIANLLHVTGNYKKLLNIYRFGPYIDVLRINPIIKGSN